MVIRNSFELEVLNHQSCNPLPKSTQKPNDDAIFDIGNYGI